MAENNKLGTAANAMHTISTVAVSVADLLKSDGNWEKIKSCDVWMIEVQNEGILRVFYNGNTPTDSLGSIVGSGFKAQGISAEDIIMIKDATSAVDPVVFISPRVLVSNITID